MIYSIDMRGGLKACGLVRLWAVMVVWVVGGCGDEAESPSDSTPASGWEQHTLQVPLDYGNAAGGDITVEYGIRRASGERKGFILWLTGGPGVNVFDFEPTVRAFGTTPSLSGPYDYVYFNLRGVGETATPIACAEPDSTKTEEEQLYDCFNEIDQRIALRTISTSNAARDLHELCKAIGCGAWTAVYGQSYGTRLAQEYVKRFPDEVQRVVLDGVLSPNATLYSTEGPRYNESLQQAFAHCESDSGCSSVLNPCATVVQGQPNNFNTVLGKLLEAANNGQLVVPFDDEASGQSGTIQVDSDRVVSILYLLVRQSDTKGYIPNFVSDYCKPQDERQVFNSIVYSLFKNPNVFGRFNGYVNVVMNCNESFRFDSLTEEQLAEVEQQGGIFGDGGYRETVGVCNQILSFIAPEQNEFTTEFVQSNVKGCVLSGSEDPVTPLDWATAVQARLPQTALTAFPLYGHVVMPTSCGSTITTQCVDPAVRSVDTTCVQSLASPYDRVIRSASARTSAGDLQTETAAQWDALAHALVHRALASGTLADVRAARHATRQ